MTEKDAAVVTHLDGALRDGYRLAAKMCTGAANGMRSGRVPMMGGFDALAFMADVFLKAIGEA